MKKTVLFFLMVVFLGTMGVTGLAWAQTKSFTAKPYTPSKTVFISSQAYNGNLGGINGADQFCQRLATKAGLTGTYKAWLSAGSDQNPYTRFTRSTGPYKLRNGLTVANNFNEIWTTGRIQNAISIDERGIPLRDPVTLKPLEEVFVWTGMYYDRTKPGWIVYKPTNCHAWQDNNYETRAICGKVDHITSGRYGTTAWSALGDASAIFYTSNCYWPKRIYCFQQ